MAMASGDYPLTPRDVLNVGTNKISFGDVVHIRRKAKGLIYFAFLCSDILLGAPYADPYLTRKENGQVAVVYGRSDGFPRKINLGSLPKEQGFILNGIRNVSQRVNSGDNDMAGSALGQGTGDVNGDGIE